MRHALFAALIVAVATPAVAGDFVRDGEQYHYTATRLKSGDVMLRGSAGIDAFNLRVHGQDVSGTVGISPVEFTVPAETVAQLNAQVDGTSEQASIAPPALAAN